jgi:2'-5' RNA ligase
MEATVRAFIAIGLSPDVRRWLVDTRTALEPRTPSGSVRWTDPQGIHITLKFLGEIPARREAEIRAVMDQTAQGCRPFELIAEGLGCFPNVARPRVVWAGIRREPALWDLQQRLEDGLEKAGFARERRAFSPHLTLGRVRDGVADGSLAEIGRAVEGAATGVAGKMEVTGFCLYRSVLRPGGAEYSVLYRAAFTG